ncbi:hypothetical protein DCCM_0146 [Desulfocucumis palustris]|uniref:Uncharacterized protein n=1 Tax=Desulfocucumis palustris TaxID=1898651 RepID=A0A2L2X708_9FIRM|nr:hypothetical protein DCCM_0146 [Desulfocucumis palustris]
MPGNVDILILQEEPLKFFFQKMRLMIMFMILLLGMNGLLIKI